MAEAATNSLNFEQVWAMFQETDRKFQELRDDMRETDRRMQETDRQMKETARQMKETDRKIGELGNRFGELAEHLVAPKIREKFNALGFALGKTSNNVEIGDDQNAGSSAEIDILLENGGLAIAIEVKAKPKDQDIDRHLERMEVLRRWADRHEDKRKFRGAIAGAIMSDAVRKYALKAGFYVIEQSGDTVEINVPSNFSPREW